jgi:AcrR family transcriptional regulator
MSERTDASNHPGSPRATPGIRARNREAIEQEILATGRRHLAEHGAAALSLRAVARDLGMVPSALYRYVRNRDELLTLLIVSAYTSLAEAVETAHDAVDPHDLPARWTAVGTALRDWALSHPHEYSLLYGSPVPDYEAPAESTNEPGTRVQALLVRLLADATRTGRTSNAAATISTRTPQLATRAAGPLLEDPFFEGAGLTAETLMAGLTAWTLLLGAVSSEVFHQLGDTITDPDAYFHYLLDLAGALVLAPPAPPVTSQAHHQATHQAQHQARSRS